MKEKVRDKRSFYLGYYLHLLLDEAWEKRIFRPQKQRFLSQFADEESFVRAVKKIGMTRTSCL